ncbi:MAG: hypothetical protein HYX92_17305 [Chloroflexi bacterium]|nr:hypothetical protein [Chloroflexota bacterium]
MTQDNDTGKRWRRTARARQRFELAGLAFAKKHGASPEDYARHLWSTGAARWMGKTSPTARDYLLKEAEAFRTLYPEVGFHLREMDDAAAELTFTSGCLGGWGQDRWAMAESLGLNKEDVCRYCRESFKVWSKQLGLDASLEPQVDGTCVLKAKKPPLESSDGPG